MRLKPVLLMVDDDAEFRTTLETVVSRLGITIKTTGAPDQFLEYASRFSPDLFLIDLQLPRVSGFDLIKCLREQKYEKPIVVVSGKDGTSIVTQSFELGATDFILKPLDKRLLVTTLSRYVRLETLKEHSFRTISPSEGRTPIHLGFDAKISDVDELGLNIVTCHFIPKGTVLKLKSNILLDMGSLIDEALVTVTSTSSDSIGAGFYKSYAEFENPFANFGDGLRQWITKNLEAHSSDR